MPPTTHATAGQISLYDTPHLPNQLRVPNQVVVLDPDCLLDRRELVKVATENELNPAKCRLNTVRAREEPSKNARVLWWITDTIRHLKAMVVVVVPGEYGRTECSGMQCTVS
jgi:hypothetical protein